MRSCASAAGNKPMGTGLLAPFYRDGRLDPRVRRAAESVLLRVLPSGWLSSTARLAVKDRGGVISPATRLSAERRSLRPYELRLSRAIGMRARRGLDLSGRRLFGVRLDEPGDLPELPRRLPFASRRNRFPRQRDFTPSTFSVIPIRAAAGQPAIATISRGIAPRSSIPWTWHPWKSTAGSKIAASWCPDIIRTR